MSQANASKSVDRRKLVAILYADMAGYSRLIGLDDTRTLQRLRALRRGLIDPTSGVHGDEGEQAMLDLVPFAGARRQVGHGYFQVGLIGEALQFALP